MPGAGMHPPVMVLLSMVTAPFRASARPSSSVARVFSVMLVRARMFPWNRVSVPSVAELPTYQYTSHASALLMVTTEALLALMSVLPIWKTKSASGFPCASSVNVPVRNAEDEKK